MNLWLGGMWGGLVRDFGKVMYILLYLTNKRPVVQHMGLCSMFCVSLDGRRV